MRRAARVLVCISAFSASLAAAQEVIRSGLTIGGVALLSNQSARENTESLRQALSNPDPRVRAAIVGSVIDAQISSSGCIKAARIIRSVPALDVAVLRAVLEWKYEPVLLDGRPVPVVMTVTVNFLLQ
jgi:hypothetical protein